MSLRKLSNMLLELLSLDYGILKTPLKLYWGTMTLTGLATLTRKSTSSGCFFLGYNMVSWFSKKHNSISLSIVEVEYIAIGSSCLQLVYMQSMMQDYGVSKDAVTLGMTLYCDNLSAINISKNLVQYSRTKHIDIRHHFI